MAESGIPTVYLNGECVPVAEARLPVDGRGVLFGLGFFETFRTNGGRPHHWNYHQSRLVRACTVAGLKLPETFLARDERRLHFVVQRFLREQSVSDAVFRYTITAGRSDHEVSEMLAMRPLPSAAPVEGIRLRVLNFRRDSGEWVPRPKSLNYSNAWLGADELRRRTSEPSDEGLFLTREGGFLVETARQNIAWMIDGRLRFPDPALGAIAGTCFEWVLGLGLYAEPRRAQLDELLEADAIFVTNSVRGITPVDAIFDASDRRLRHDIGSRSNPVIASVRNQWLEALDATARG